MKKTNDIKEAIVLLGGLGTRMLPLSKVVGKEMLPIFDAPLLHKIVLECYNSGIRKMIFVVTKFNKKLIEKYFSNDPYLDNYIKNNPSKQELLKELKMLIKEMKFVYVYQQERGTYGALYSARKYIKNDNFLVLYDDELIINDVSSIDQVINAFKKENKMIIGTIEDKKETVGLVVTDKDNNFIDLKRSNETKSRNIIVGRMVLNKKVFTIRKLCKFSKENELFLPQAIVHHLNGEAKILKIKGEYFNIGSKLGYLKASLLFATKSIYKDEIKDYINKL
jgi:UTP--glucose-1-phosphate uridylyltransferase